MGMHRLQTMITNRHWRFLAEIATRGDRSIASILRALIDDAIEKQGWIDTGFPGKSAKENE